MNVHLGGQYTLGFQTGTGSLGPTNVVHVYDSSSPAEWSYDSTTTPGTFYDELTNATLPPGQSYVLDLDEVGLIVSVIDIIGERMNLELEFTKLGSANNFNRTETPYLQCENGEMAMPKKLNKGINFMDLDASSGSEQLDIGIDSISCDPEDEMSGIDLFVYSEYPLHIFPPYNSDKAIDAVAKVHYDCPSANGSAPVDFNSYCETEGFCLETGYGNVDACDFFQAPPDHEEPKTYSASNGAVICFRDQDSKWVIGTSCWSTYSIAYDDSCPWNWDNHKDNGGLTQVVADCFPDTGGRCNNLPGPTLDECAQNGLCIDFGHSTFDACDYLPVENDSQSQGTKVFYSESKDKVIKYKGDGWWDFGLRDSGFYLNYQCGITWAEATSMADVFNDCFLPNLRTGTGTEQLGDAAYPNAVGASCNKQGLSVQLGDKLTYEGRVWDHMSREVFVFADYLSANTNIQSQVNCVSPDSQCWGEGLFSPTDGYCQSCFDNYELITGLNGCRSWTSHNECCQECPEDTFKDPHTGRCVRECHFGSSNIGTLPAAAHGCTDKCAPGERYVEVEVERGYACSQLAMDFAQFCFSATSCSAPFTMIMNRVDDDLMTDTYLAYRGENWGNSYTFDCFAGVSGEDVCAMWSNYNWISTYSHYTLCDDYQGLRNISMGCYGPESTIVDSTNSQYRNWAEGSDSTTWCVDDKVMGYSVLGLDGQR